MLAGAQWLSKDIVFVASANGTSGIRQWLDTYYGTQLSLHDIADRCVLAATDIGVLRGAVHVDIPAMKFDRISVACGTTR